ncbi:methyltransferase isoform X2 [Wolffia australiana]
MRIISVSKKRSQGVQLLVEEYEEKIRLYCNMDILQLKSNPKNTRDVKAQIEGEDALVFQNIRPEDMVIMLDERGLDMGSTDLAELVRDAGERGSSRLVFCIGGSYGHGPQLRARANVTIKLSSMVLNHQIALIVLLEQLYRAWTILKGQKYHH